MFLLIEAQVFAIASPTDNFFEIDGDFDSNISDVDGDGVMDITDGTLPDQHSTWGRRQGSGINWTHLTSSSIYPYMGTNMYLSSCIASPTTDNDRTEQMMLSQFKESDGVRYFSLAFCMPTTSETPTNWLYLAQLHQGGNRSPALRFSIAGSTFSLARYYDSWVNGIYKPLIYDELEFNKTITFTKGVWYNFMFAVSAGTSANNGIVSAYYMNPDIGTWEKVCSFSDIQIGYKYLDDGITSYPQDFTWKIGTYRGTQNVKTDILYDNCSYGRLWSIITKNYLIGYHKAVLDLKFDSGSGTIAPDTS